MSAAYWFIVGYLFGAFVAASFSVWLYEYVVLKEREKELEGVHLALAEADVPRSAGVDEPLWSEQHRVRLLRERAEAGEERERKLREAGEYIMECVDRGVVVSHGLGNGSPIRRLRAALASSGERTPPPNRIVVAPITHSTLCATNATGHGACTYCAQASTSPRETTAATTATDVAPKSSAPSCHICGTTTDVHAIYCSAVGWPPSPSPKEGAE